MDNELMDSLRVDLEISAKEEEALIENVTREIRRTYHLRNNAIKAAIAELQRKQNAELEAMHEEEKGR